MSLVFNNKRIGFNGKRLAKPSKPTPVDPWNPLNLPAYTIRVQLTDTSYDCATQGFNGTWVSRGNGVWDVTYNNTIWSRLLTDSIGFWGKHKEHRILGINSTGVTNMERFEDCGQRYLIGTIPLFDTTALTDVTNMFYECYYVEGGALALYQQMSTQTNVPSDYDGCFHECGSNTITGSEELDQISSDWGGNEGAEEYCPNCGEPWDGIWCGNCGYPDNEGGDDPDNPFPDDPGAGELG